MIQSPVWPTKSFKIIVRFLVWCPQNDCWYGTPTSYWTFKIQPWIYISSNLVIPSSLFPAPPATQVGQSLANLVTKAGCREKEGVDVFHPWPVQCKHPAGKSISKVCQSLQVWYGRLRVSMSVRNCWWYAFWLLKTMLTIANLCTILEQHSTCEKWTSVYTQSRGQLPRYRTRNLLTGTPPLSPPIIVMMMMMMMGIIAIIVLSW